MEVINSVNDVLTYLLSTTDSEITKSGDLIVKDGLTTIFIYKNHIETYLQIFIDSLLPKEEK